MNNCNLQKYHYILEIPLNPTITYIYEGQVLIYFKTVKHLFDVFLGALKRAEKPWPRIGSSENTIEPAIKNGLEQIFFT